MTSFGLVACGVTFRRDASGCPATGRLAKAEWNGVPGYWIEAGQREVQ